MEKTPLVDRLRLRHLQTFLTVCEEGHVGRSAARLGLTQPAVSKTLAELDDIVGTRLIDRGRRGARPTRRGEEFLPAAMAARDAFQRAVTAAGRLPAMSAEAVQIGALPTVAPDLFPEALLRFRLTRPDSRVRLLTAPNSTLLQWLTSGVVDVVLGRMSDPSSMAGLTFEWLYVEPLALVVRPEHPLAGIVEPSIDRILACPLVVATPNTVPRHNVESFLKSKGAMLPDHIFETISVSVARLVVLGSDAIWFAPAGAVRDDLHRGVLQCLPLSMAGTEEPVGILRRRDGDVSSATKDFTTALHALCDNRRQLSIIG